ncbi:uncharacterized protein F5Z01DRAFT_332088 [Emericellopsis atlantica]|uniref:N-acetyltransferase domain-containing protein n=1 Tax=Emericellopsis atlantica TaxID=2614577 RepID=A0A9P7ZFE7_9HYPO|nr:uncharacterized protein F5Z01DRAFT_332088 [Emericellopsis atlantica]KAG9251094.1 hypothetical protein F5Z01DRAFT_332088 [Emericellopsis atlantica]
MSFRRVQHAYRRVPGEDVTDEMLGKAAQLFNENYGTWGPQSDHSGEAVKLSPRRLRAQYLPKEATVIYVMVTVDGELAGNAFACLWRSGDVNICWITQLVVGKQYRQRGLAVGLLRLLRDDSIDRYGIMSSHPAACLAAANAFCSTIERVPIEFIRTNAQAILSSSPIPYVSDAKLSGSLFESSSTSGLVSGVDTQFFVDHTEPLEVLNDVRKKWNWPLGGLPDGNEYLLILPRKSRRSRSRSGSHCDTTV